MGSRWGCCSGLLPVDSLLQREQSCPASSRPALPCFSAPQRDRACHNWGSVFISGMNFQTSKTVTQNQRGKMRTFLRQVWGEETDPPLLSTILGDYRNPLVSTLGHPNQQRPCVHTKGLATPGAGSREVVSIWRVWKCVPRCRVGLCGSHPIHMGQDPVYSETTYLLFTCSVSCPLGDSQHLNWGYCPD